MKKIIILSNNPVSTTTSNGRTLLNLLGSFQNSQMLNIFVSGQIDKQYCTYYQITDKDALKSFFRHKNIGRSPLINDKTNSFSQKTIKRTSFKMILRNIIWSNKCIYNTLKNQIFNFNPDVLVFQVGDSIFMIKIALFIKETFNIPIIIYNSEDYYFKEWNYIEPNKGRNLFFRILQKHYRELFEDLMERAFATVFLTEDLKNLYIKRFNNSKFFVIYNASSSNAQLPTNYRGDCNFPVYSGNLSVGRSLSIIKAAEIIFTLTSQKLVVYSADKNVHDLNLISSCPFIDFRGSISYLENLLVLKNCLFCLHVESFDEFFAQDTIHAFSGKIPDCLASGRPFVFFGPSTTTCYRYLSQNKCGFVASNENELLAVITKIINADSAVRTTLQNAKNIVSKNHDKNTNSNVFKKIIDISK